MNILLFFSAIKNTIIVVVTASTAFSEAVNMRIRTRVSGRTEEVEEVQNLKQHLSRGKEGFGYYLSPEKIYCITLMKSKPNYSYIVDTIISPQFVDLQQNSLLKSASTSPNCM